MPRPKRTPVGPSAPRASRASAAARPRPGREQPAGAEPAVLGFAAAVFVFHQLPALVGPPAGDVIDFGTPLAVIGAATGVLVALRARGAVLGAALLAGVLYVHGQGVHLAANSIANAGPGAELRDIVRFWDEELSHVEIVLGWFGLVASFCLAERAEFHRSSPSAKPRVVLLAFAAALLGWSFFTSTVEGGTWPLELAATAAFAIWAARERRPVLRAAATAFAFGALLIGAWAAWQGGVPEFSETELWPSAQLQLEATGSCSVPAPA